MARPSHARTLAASVLATVLLSTTARPAVALELTPSKPKDRITPSRSRRRADADWLRSVRAPARRVTSSWLCRSRRHVRRPASPGAPCRDLADGPPAAFTPPQRSPRQAVAIRRFQGYGAAITGPTGGSFEFLTIMPGRYEGRPRHIHVKVTPSGGKTFTTQFISGMTRTCSETASPPAWARR